MRKDILKRLNALRMGQGHAAIIVDEVDGGYIMDGAHYTEEELESYIELFNVDTLIVDNL